MRRYCARECRFRHNAPSRPSGVNGARVRNGTTPGGHVLRSTLRTAVAVVTAGLTLTACGSDDGGSGGGGGSNADAASATSAEDLGGICALLHALNDVSTLNLIPLAPFWAHYGEML